MLASASSAAPSSTSLDFRPSFAAGTRDDDGRLLAGTEIMHLVPHQGRLYAANSLWMERDPAVPKACQVLVLAAPDGRWKLDHQFASNNLRLASLKEVTFSSDGRGGAIRPVTLLLAAPDVAAGGTIEIFSRDDEAGTWAPMAVGRAGRYSTTRALGLHRDSTTGVDRIFAGNDTRGILSGVYDPGAPGRIRWQPTPEFPVPGEERAMGFCNANGVFYVATTRGIFRRTDGPTPVWTQVYSCPGEKSPVGIRGLTAVPNPAGAGESLLFAALSKVRRIDPADGFKETIELDMPEFLTGLRGIKVGFALAAYNEFLPCVMPATGERVWLFGFESSYPPAVVEAKPPPDLRLFTREGYRWYFDARAQYFIRHAEGDRIRYEVAEVTDPRGPTLVAVRAIAESPFPGDRGRAFYFGGFDCNSQPSHHTAWIYRGEGENLDLAP
jgi:poly(A) polymerase